MYGASLYGNVDKIILTGGISHSELITEEVIKRVSYLAPVKIIPGEMEMKALALGAYRVLMNTEKAKVYN
jgi:butyrate kinase